jgi:hypothetical protein
VPPGGGFGQPGFPTPAAVPVRGVVINETPAMILGAVTAFFCCLPGGIIALLLAQNAKTAAMNGDQAGAESKLRTSMMVSGGSIVLALSAICLYVVFAVALQM